MSASWTATRAFAEGLSRVHFSDVPERVQRGVRLLVLDGLGCAVAGAHHGWAERSVDALAPHERSSGGAAVWFHRRTADPATAVLLNGAFIQGSELDDYNEFSPLHASSVVLPAALASSAADARLQSFFDAALAGYEAAARVGLAMGGAAVVARGWHSGGVFGPLAAAASAGRARGLSGERLEHALGIAATQSAGLMSAQYSGDVKRLHHGFAGRNGLVAASLAAAGVDGIEDVFGHPYGGFASTFLGDVARADLDALTLELGQEWRLGRIGVKYYPCMIGLHSIIDGLQELRHEVGFEASEVDAVQVGLSSSVHRRAAFELTDEPDELGAQMNAAYVAAVALLDDEVWLDQFALDHRVSAGVTGLRRRVSVVADAEIDAGGPTTRMSSRLAVTLRDGRTFEVRSPAPSVRRPDLDPERVIEKFGRMVGPALGDERRDALVDLVLSDSPQSSVADLLELIA